MEVHTIIEDFVQKFKYAVHRDGEHPAWLHLKID